MNDLLTITAEVLEKTASYIDSIESARVEAEKEATMKIASEIKDRLSAAVGEDVSDSVAAKLAEHKDVLSLVSKIAGVTAPANKMGEASEIVDGRSLTPRTVKEAADAAENSFVTWLSQ